LGRYAINDSANDWSVAESQVTSGAKGLGGAGKATIVSVKSNEAASGKKRKAGGDWEGGKEKKPTRRGKKMKR
jgi:N-acetyltransferase 10